MKTSARGIELLKQFEGLELEAYQDIADIWTIGYGHTGPEVQLGMRITEAEAEDLLRKDLKSREKAAERLSAVDLNQNEFDALVSFIYNVGEAAFSGSTARKRLNRNDRFGAAEALTWWNKARVGGVLRPVLGLTRRRAAERALFLTPVNAPIVREPTELDENTRVAAVEDPPRRDNVASSRTVQGATIAGGAGVASSSIGRENAQELDRMETNIENGDGLTDHTPPGTAPPANDDLQEGDATETEQPTGEMIAIDDARPSKHEVHAVEAQVQFALLILIILSVLFVIYARFDDWREYRR